MQLDLTGLTVTAIQTTAFIMLLIGVYPANRRNDTANLIKHGLLITIATAINLATVLAGKVTVFSASSPSTQPPALSNSQSHGCTQPQAPPHLPQPYS